MTLCWLCIQFCASRSSCNTSAHIYVMYDIVYDCTLSTANDLHHIITFLLAVNVLGRLTSKAISSKRAVVSSIARNSCLIVLADHLLHVKVKHMFERIQGAACSTTASHKQCAMWLALLLLPCHSHGSCMQGEHMFERIQGGLLNDGLCSVFAALGTILPTTTFAENNGVVSLTRCAGCAIQVLLFLSSFWGVCVLGLSVD